MIITLKFPFFYSDFYHLMKTQGRILFYLLAGYVILQFVWWAFTLISLNEELRMFWQINQDLGGASMLEEDYFSKRFFMIIGEGVVFLTILIAGMIFVHRYMKREALIAKAERNFVLSVSHELKTPLASVRLMLQTLLKKDLPEAKRIEIINTAIADNKRLSSITDNVLVVARMEQGDTLYVKEKVDLTALVKRSLKSLVETVLRKHKVTINLAENVIVNGDQDLLESVIINLVDNASKYSAKGTDICIELVQKGGRAIIEISDHGLGIAKDEKEHVFKRFYRSGEESVRRSKGTGLGLFIVNQIVKAHLGKISIEDNQPQGSVFQVSLPLITNGNE
ncbi:MAG: two-component system sensor histidine kinase CiaH [Flavobacteriales bacterium]|jgi:two-component system sensor histidine kinase CiaH